MEGNVRKSLSMFRDIDPEVVKEINDILNDPNYDKKRGDEQKAKDQARLNEVHNFLNNNDISNEKVKSDMPYETKTTEQTTNQVNTDSTTKTTANSLNSERLADILWDASTKHPFITIGLISGILMFGGIKLKEYVISRGVYMGNMKTLKTIYRMTR